MTSHDPLCRLNLSDCDHGDTRVCHCELIARLRERIAGAIEAAPEHHVEDGPMSAYYAAIVRNDTPTVGA